jgi:PAS domain S-box-containing protein
LLYGETMLEQLAHRANDVEHLGRMFEHAPGFMAVVEGPDLRFAVANQAFRKLVGRNDLIGKTLTEALPELDDQGIDEMLVGVARSGEAFVAHALPLTVVRENLVPEELVLDLVFQPVSESSAIFIQGHDVTDDKRSEMLRTAHARVLGLAISDSPLEQTLGELIRIVETTSSTGVLGSILLLDAEGKRLRHGAAPSLPRAYCEAIDGTEIGACVGSCGTAAHLGAAVYVSDIATDPLWADFKDLALGHGLRACWSIPILTRGRDVVGTFAMYHREPREPTFRDLMLVDLITQTAALVIDRERAHAAVQNAAAAHASIPG